MKTKYWTDENTIRVCFYDGSFFDVYSSNGPKETYILYCYFFNYKEYLDIKNNEVTEPSIKRAS